MPRSEQKIRKAKLPSLEQRFDYRESGRRTPIGLAMEALGGDKESIAQLAKIGAVLMHDLSAMDDEETDHAFWLASILADIGNGKSPDEAFGWKPAAHLRRREKFEDLRKALRIATTIEKFSLSVKGKSYAHAVTHASELWGIDEAKCRRVMTGVVAGPRNLSQAQGIELALDMVAHFGAYGYRVGRDTAFGYYKDLIASRGNVR